MILQRKSRVVQGEIRFAEQIAGALGIFDITHMLALRDGCTEIDDGLLILTQAQMHLAAQLEELIGLIGADALWLDGGQRFPCLCIHLLLE